MAAEVLEAAEDSQEEVMTEDTIVAVTLLEEGIEAATEAEPADIRPIESSEVP